MIPDPITRKPAQEVNAESEGHLCKLGQAMGMYANDYENRFPDTMDSLQSYGIDLAWCKNHVAYLGKGKSINDDPELVIAYDKSMLKDKEYTVALMISSYVEVMTREDLTAKRIESEDVISMSRIREVGLAMLMYADDHDGTFPDTLESIASYMALTFSGPQKI